MTSLKRILVVLGYALLLGVLAAGCGSSGGSSGGGSASGSSGSSGGGTTEPTKAAAGQVVKTIEVQMTEFKFNPADITLNKPGTYVFEAVNSGQYPHALEIEGKGIEEETKNLSAGQSADLKVTLEPGTYEVYCPVDGHRERGMEGTLTVQGDSASSGSGGSGGGY